MKRGRPGLRKKDHNGRGLDQIDYVILNILEKQPMTFSGIEKKLGISPSTLTDHLKKLEKIEYVGRYPDDQRIYILASKARSVTEMIPRLLSSDVFPPFKPDLDSSRKLFNEKIIDAIKEARKRIPMVPWHTPEIASRLWGEFAERYGEKTITPIDFITVLAAYHVEKEPDFFFDVREEEKKKLVSRTVVLPFIKQQGLAAEFDQLLKWFEPLRKNSLFAGHIYMDKVLVHFIYSCFGPSPRAPPSRGERKEGK